MLTPTGMSGGLFLSAEGDLHAGDEAPLLFPEGGPVDIVKIKIIWFFIYSILHFKQMSVWST